MKRSLFTMVAPGAGRNIHALDPYRMPGAAALQRGAAVADSILASHKATNSGTLPQTVSVNLWGLDAIKTKARRRPPRPPPPGRPGSPGNADTAGRCSGWQRGHPVTGPIRGWWGQGESVAIVLQLVGARPLREGTGRIARFELVPLEELGRPRIVPSSPPPKYRLSCSAVDRVCTQVDHPQMSLLGAHHRTSSLSSAHLLPSELLMNDCRMCCAT